MFRVFVKYDLENGLVKSSYKLIPAFFTGPLYFLILKTLYSPGEFAAFEQARSPLLLFFIYLFSHSMLMWLIPQVSLFFVISNYASNDLRKFGNKLLILGKSRQKWYWSKCITVILTVISMYAFLILGAMLVWRDRIFTPEHGAALFWEFIVTGMGFPFLFSLIVSLFQMILPLFFKTQFTHALSLILLLVLNFSTLPNYLSVYYTPLSEGIPLYKIMETAGNRVVFVVFACILAILIALFGGAIRMQKQDLF